MGGNRTLSARADRHFGEESLEYAAQEGIRSLPRAGAPSPAADRGAGAGDGDVAAAHSHETGRESVVESVVNIELITIKMHHFYAVFEREGHEERPPR